MSWILHKVLHFAACIRPFGSFRCSSNRPGPRLGFNYWSASTYWNCFALSLNQQMFLIPWEHTVDLQKMHTKLHFGSVLSWQGVLNRFIVALGAHLNRVNKNVQVISSDLQYCESYREEPFSQLAIPLDLISISRSSSLNRRLAFENRSS